MKPTMNIKPVAIAPQMLEKLRTAIAQAPSNTQTEPSLPQDTSNIKISKLDFEDSLAKALLPSNYTPKKNENGMYEVHRSYLHLADQRMKTTDSAEKLQSITDSLAFNSRQAHTKVRDMFGQLGDLTKETDSLLIQSEKYLYSELTALHNIHAEKYHDRTARNLKFMPSFEFEVTTQEGDKVTMKFGYSMGVAASVYSNGVQLEVEVDGELSAEENKALSALYDEVGKYVEQTMTSDSTNFAVTAFDLAQGFDANLLSGFEVSTSKAGMNSNFSYEIDKENNQQRLKAGMGLHGDVLNYNLDITTALSGKGSDKEKDKVLATLLSTLEKMDTGTFMDSQVNKFLTQTFASVLTNTNPENKEPVDLATINQAIDKMSKRLEGHSLKGLSELADYQFSLKLSQLSNLAYHESTIKMGQDTERKIDSLGQHVKQTKSLQATMYMMRTAVNTTKGHEVNWNLDKEQTTAVSVDNDNELTHHKISGHHRETLEKKEFVDNFLKHTFAQQVDSSFSQELEVLESTAKLTINERDEHKGGLYSRVGDKPKDTLAESRYVREYKQVLNFERKDRQFGKS